MKASSVTQRKWRVDGRCGRYYPLPDGTPGQCYPDGDKPCCSDKWDGMCGNTAEHCSCGMCLNYTRIYREWEQSGGIQNWRGDGKCGEYYLLPDGTPGQCDPDGKYPCCDWREGRCSGTRNACTCSNCIDFRKIKWRSDGRCGRDYPLSDGSPAECNTGLPNPGLPKPCCNQDKRCSARPADCFCADCKDHRLTVSWKDRMCDPLRNNVSYTFNLNSVFRCDNGIKCVGYGDVCNYKDDCGDMSDEIYCTKHVICKNTLEAEYPRFTHRICDGFPDCFDWSYECNGFCGKQILESWLLKIACCFLGILAILLNCISMIHGVTSMIYDCPTEKMMVTKLLVSLIGLGDFLMGVYLIVLSIYDSLVYGSSYCENQPKWLTGTPCKILGVISTVGSQVSLFSMTTLSCIIMYGVVFKKMRFPSEVTKRSILKVTFLALTLLTVSMVIAVTPLIHSLEDYFVQSVYYDLNTREYNHPKYYQSNTGYLVGFIDKSRNRDILPFHNIYDSDKHSNSWSWSDIRKYMFEYYGDLISYPVHFYGNDGVCLFKYFFRRDNEYTQENILEKDWKDRTPDNDYYYFNVTVGDEIIKTRNVTVWTMLMVNLICFVVMTVCYIAIVWDTMKSTQESGQRDNPDRLVQNKAMQNRIILIIVTDFLCWVPFIIVSGMHNLKYIDASTWYTPFAMTLLPINSVINPLLYDKILLALIIKRIRSVGEFITCQLRKMIIWVESTRLFQGTVTHVGRIREYIIVRLGNISVRAALNRLYRGRNAIENVTLENDIPMQIVNQ